VGITSPKVNWIVDADLQNFLGSVSQEWLVRFLEHRIGDKRIIRLIQKWLRAGILEDGFAMRSQVVPSRCLRRRRASAARDRGRIAGTPRAPGC
jgi:retron-type reverse transcriptase